MTSRERIQKTLSHESPDKLPIDFGSWPETGMHVSVVSKLRHYFGLNKSKTPVKVIEPYQMLGEIKDDLKEIIGIDTTILDGEYTFFGYKKDNWKEWKMWDGTLVLVPEGFNTKPEKDGSIFMFPQDDRNAPPSAKMPVRGFFFDSIIRQKKIEENKLDPKDNLEEFQLFTKSEIDYLRKKAEYLYKNTNYSILGMLGDSSLGDVALVPGPSLKNPKGIRDVEEFYISLYTRKDYLKKVFNRQCEIAIENNKRIYKALGNKVDIIYSSGADFGMQNGLLISVDTYRNVFKPFHKKVNNWIHENTKWKCHIHTDGAIYNLIPDLIDAGFDTLNPVQISAFGMDPKKLKKEFGKDIVFWGGGVDTQKTLPFLKPEDVKREVRKLIEIFSPGGGFVFSSIHNIQQNVPIENIIAMIEVLQEYRK
jgi:hypothetical protein